jgi:hypothetical protein
MSGRSVCQENITAAEPMQKPHSLSFIEIMFIISKSYELKSGFVTASVNMKLGLASCMHIECWRHLIASCKAAAYKIHCI